MQFCIRAAHIFQPPRQYGSNRIFLLQAPGSSMPDVGKDDPCKGKTEKVFRRLFCMYLFRYRANDDTSLCADFSEHEAYPSWV